MRFIDPRIFDIRRPQPGPQENMQIGSVRCAISQIWPKFREKLGENLADIHLWPLIAGLVGVMNIINGIARGFSPCVRAPPMFGRWGVNAVGEEYLRKWCALQLNAWKCVVLVGRIPWLKG